MEIKKLLNSHFLRSSLVVITISTGVNFLNYLFNLIMARLLSPILFGEVATLIGLSMIIQVPANSLTTVLAKKTSTLKAQGKINQIHSQFASLTHQVFILASLATIILWLTSPILSQFLHISLVPILIFTFLLPLSLMIALNQGVLQGLSHFGSFSISQLLATFLKLVLAVLATILSLKVSGVMTALVVAACCTYFYSYTQVSRYFSGFKLEKIKHVLKPSHRLLKIPESIWTVFFTTLFITLYSYVDLPLAKHFLASKEAGEYSALSVLGKTVSYISNSFLVVLLPFITSSVTKRDKKELYFLKVSLMLVSMISLGTVFLFTILPDLVVSLLFGSKYLQISPFLASFGLAMFFNTLSLVFIYFFMAKSLTVYLYPLGVTLMAQIFLISFFSQSIASITWAFLFSSLLQLLSMLAVFFYQRDS